MAPHPASTAPRNHRAEWDTATPNTGSKGKSRGGTRLEEPRGKLEAVLGSDCKGRISAGLGGLYLSKSQPRVQKTAGWLGGGSGAAVSRAIRRISRRCSSFSKNS